MKYLSYYLQNLVLTKKKESELEGFYVMSINTHLCMLTNCLMLMFDYHLSCYIVSITNIT
jgi:hypothetical protein